MQHPTDEYKYKFPHNTLGWARFGLNFKMKKMKKEKENEIVLAELGDKLLAEKVKLEEELSIIDRRVKDLDTKIKTKKVKEEENLYVHFSKFTAQNRGYKIMKRLEEINKELKNGK